MKFVQPINARLTKNQYKTLLALCRKFGFGEDKSKTLRKIINDAAKHYTTGKAH